MYHANFDINLPTGVAKLLGGVSEWSPTNDHDAFGARQDSRVATYRSLNNTCVFYLITFTTAEEQAVVGAQPLVAVVGVA